MSKQQFVVTVVVTGRLSRNQQQKLEHDISLVTQQSVELAHTTGHNVDYEVQVAEVIPVPQGSSVVVNRVVGEVSGTLIQTAGDIHGGLDLRG